MNSATALPYQLAVRTGCPATVVLDQVEVNCLPGITVAERGPHYLVLRPEQRHRYGADLAAGLAIAIVLLLLIGTAITPLVLAGLPLAFLPAIPLLFDHRADLAVSAIEEDGVTRVTVHGQASADLAAHLDAFLGTLPAPNGGTYGELADIDLESLEWVPAAAEPPYQFSEPPG
ncbi:MAG: hypothetical protein ABSA40_01000 [Candidatus Dormibacteria bacterium]